MVSGKVGATLVALSMAACSPAARLEVRIDPQPPEVARVGVEVSGEGRTSTVEVEAPHAPGAGLRVALPVVAGTQIVTVRSRDENGVLVLEGRRVVEASPPAVAVCEMSLRPRTALSDLSGTR